MRALGRARSGAGGPVRASGCPGSVAAGSLSGGRLASKTVAAGSLAEWFPADRAQKRRVSGFGCGHLGGPDRAQVVSSFSGHSEQKNGKKLIGCFWVSFSRNAYP